MRSLIRPYRRKKSRAYPAAEGFEKLPINLLRTGLVTRQPEVTAQAAQEYLQMMRSGDEPPMMLPQSMQFGHWNRQQGPSGVSRGDLTPPYASATSFTSAMRQSGTSRVPRVVSPAPQQPMSEAAARLGAQIVPQPVTVMPHAPMSRRFPTPPPADAPPPAAFARGVVAAQQLRRDQRASAQVYAMSEAQTAAEAMQIIFRTRGK